MFLYKPRLVTVYSSMAVLERFIIGNFKSQPPSFRWAVGIGVGLFYNDWDPNKIWSFTEGSLFN